MSAKGNIFGSDIVEKFKITMLYYCTGSYFCYDTPGSLQDHIIEDMDVDTVKYVSLYSLYSWPNVILSFVGGFLIDRYSKKDLLFALIIIVLIFHYWFD